MWDLQLLNHGEDLFIFESFERNGARTARGHT